ncbi:MAG: DUF2282 domain-containing protein [Myxococcota bacterium]
MSSTRLMIAGGVLTLAGALAGCTNSTSTPSSTAASSDASTITVVKCVGIALKGHNDCGSTDGRHDCSGQATKDLDPTEWVYVPEGPLCEKWGGTKMVKEGKVVQKQKPAKDFIGG